MTPRASILGRSAASFASIVSNNCNRNTNLAAVAFFPPPNSCARAGTAFRVSPRAARLYSLPLRQVSTSRVASMSAASESQAVELKENTSKLVAIRENLEIVRKRVAEVTAERDEGRAAPRLVAVSKTKPIEDLKAAYDAGQRIFGENYVGACSSCCSMSLVVMYVCHGGAACFT